ncbi:hypothetical protein ABT332_14195 [Saccharomonospora azurea]|uniref:hypothetical protein n=1 Tax=Saccharomonospora azurea TaxID=40988 RepID=UPI003320253E
MNPGGADVRDLTERMVEVVRSEDVDQLARLLAQVVDPQGTRSELFTPVLTQLVGSIAGALRRRADGDSTRESPRDAVGVDGAPIFTAELVDTVDDDVAIDELDPALRAVLRAVLADLNGDAESTRIQLHLVSSDREPLARLDALWHALLWASMLGEDSGRSAGWE